MRAVDDEAAAAGGGQRAVFGDCSHGVDARRRRGGGGRGGGEAADDDAPRQARADGAGGRDADERGVRRDEGALRGVDGVRRRPVVDDDALEGGERRAEVGADERDALAAARAVDARAIEAVDGGRRVGHELPRRCRASPGDGGDGLVALAHAGRGEAARLARRAHDALGRGVRAVREREGRARRAETGADDGEGRVARGGRGARAGPASASMEGGSRRRRRSRRRTRSRRSPCRWRRSRRRFRGPEQHATEQSAAA